MLLQLSLDELDSPGWSSPCCIPGAVSLVSPSARTPAAPCFRWEGRYQPATKQWCVEVGSRESTRFSMFIHLFLLSFRYTLIQYHIISCHMMSYNLKLQHPFVYALFINQYKYKLSQIICMHITWKHAGYTSQVRSRGWQLLGLQSSCPCHST